MVNTNWTFLEGGEVTQGWKGQTWEVGVVGVHDVKCPNNQKEKRKKKKPL